MANWDYSFRGTYTPQDTRTPGQAGKEWGSAIGNISKPILDAVNESKEEDRKKQVDKLVMEYNQGAGPFAGIQGALKTEKLVRLLSPLDRALSDRYALRAKEESAKEEKIRIGTEVQKAGEGVSMYDKDELGISQNSEIDAEIALIEQALSKMSNDALDSDLDLAPYEPDLQAPETDLFENAVYDTKYKAASPYLNYMPN